MSDEVGNVIPEDHPLNLPEPQLYEQTVDGHYVPVAAGPTLNMVRKELIYLSNRIAELEQSDKQVKEAINGLGAQVQWIVDQAKVIFQMFSNPAMMAQMMGGLGGMMGDSDND